jgi:hypothetical protein
MTISRKTFIGQVTVPASTATSLYSIMRDSPLHWGYETTALTTPSMDSITGSNAGIVPYGSLVVGSDSNVSTVTSGANYRGVFVPLAANFSLQDFGSADGVIDPNQIFLYSPQGCLIDLVFTAR